ncbi:MAG: dTDP-glucose 4,6-dehydratase [Rickettsiales bacterium]|nr:dTDP-glucose 4,6-dehydratase [Rickettsiales bacterium]
MTKITPKTLLVSGGAGFIGSCFVAQCVERGQHVIVLDKLTYAGHPENLSWLDSSNYAGSYSLVEGDICDGALVSRLLNDHNVDAVVNFAAESHVDNSIANPSAFIETNINGIYTMLEASRQYWNGLQGEAKANFRMLQISTDEVYGTLGDTGKFSETTAMKPNSPYSASKAAGDHLARAWHETYGLPVVVTNCSNNYGPRQHPEKLIPRMITNALEGQPLPIYGDGKNVRDWIHVEDHAAGVYLALTEGNTGETYCFGGNAERTNIEVVHAICDVLGELAPQEGRNYRDLITFVTDRAGHDRRYAIDDSKAQAELNFTRTYGAFEDGLRQTIQWYLNNSAWCTAIKDKKAA